LASTAAGLTDQDVMRLEVSSTTLTPKINGSLDSVLGAQTDSAIASGAAGICGFETGAGVTGDDWLADNLGSGASSARAKVVRTQFMPHALGGWRTHGSGRCLTSAHLRLNLPDAVWDLRLDWRTHHRPVEPLGHDQQGRWHGRRYNQHPRGDRDLFRWGISGT